MEKIITNSTNLAHGEIEEFAEAFRNDQYEIITVDAVSSYEPELLLDRQKDKLSYAKIFDDQDATLKFFAIRYAGNAGKIVLIPIGVYGVSSRYKLRFPLYLDSFWQSFLWTTKKEFCELCGTTDDEEHDFFFLRLIDLRRAFIQKVFSYYFSIDRHDHSAMVWKLRGKDSNTRRIAEGLGFSRIEHGEHEVYSSIAFSPDMLAYMDGCLSRKGVVIGGEQEGRVDRNNARFDARLFARSIVDYHGVKTQPTP